MKHRILKGLISGALLLCGSLVSRADTFSVPWFVVAGGGGTATNGALSVTGTFGQWEATPQTLTNGVFSLANGFWGFLINPPTNSSPNTNAPSVIVDSQIVVSVTAPANNLLSTVPTVTVKGTIKNPTSIASVVQVTVNDNPPALASMGITSKGVTPWTYVATLQEGANVITAQSTNSDTNGIVSLPVTRTVFYSTNPVVAANKSTLTLQVSPGGTGTISGQKNGASLVLYKVYTVKATPASGEIFVNWTAGTNTSDVLSTNASLAFLMTPNLVLQANFAPNPFLAVAGVYNGLFSPITGVTEATSGFFTLTIATKSTGAYSGKLLVDGGTYPFTGTFDLSGDSAATVVRAGKDTLALVIHMDLGGSADDMITGSVVDFANNGWTSALLANRSVFNAKVNPATNYAGKYTLVIPPGEGAPTNSPGGYSYATLSATTAGAVAISGKLSEKTAFSQATTVSKSGEIPLYVSLYSKKGSILGWLSVTNDTTNQVVPFPTVTASNIAWIKPTVAKTLYPLGFTNTDLGAIGSIYVAPKAPANNFTLTNGTLTVAYGDLASPLVVSNLVVTGNKITSIDGSVTGAITATTGVLSLTIKPPQGGKIAATGVVLQANAVTKAAGWFAGTDESGFFLLQE